MNRNEKQIFDLSNRLVNLAKNLSNQLENTSTLSPHQKSIRNCRCKPNSKLNKNYDLQQHNNKMNAEIPKVTEETHKNQQNKLNRSDDTVTFRERILNVISENPWLLDEIYNLPDNQNSNESVPLKFLKYINAMINKHEHLFKILEPQKNFKSNSTERHNVVNNILQKLEEIILKNSAWMKQIFSINKNGGILLNGNNNSSKNQHSDAATNKRIKIIEPQLNRSEMYSSRSSNNLVQLKDFLIMQLQKIALIIDNQTDAGLLNESESNDILNVIKQLNRTMNFIIKANNHYLTTDHEEIPNNRLNVINELNRTIDLFENEINIHKKRTMVSSKHDPNKRRTQVIDEINQTIDSVKNMQIESAVNYSTNYSSREQNGQNIANNYLRVNNLNYQEQLHNKDPNIAVYPDDHDNYNTQYNNNNNNNNNHVMNDINKTLDTFENLPFVRDLFGKRPLIGLQEKQEILNDINGITKKSLISSSFVSVPIDNFDNSQNIFNKKHLDELFSDALLDTTPAELLNLTDDSVADKKDSSNDDVDIDDISKLDIDNRIVKRLLFTENTLEELQKNVNKINNTLQNLLENDPKKSEKSNAISTVKAMDNTTQGLLEDDNKNPEKPNANSTLKTNDDHQGMENQFNNTENIDDISMPADMSNLDKTVN